VLDKIKSKEKKLVAGRSMEIKIRLELENLFYDYFYTCDFFYEFCCQLKTTVWSPSAVPAQLQAGGQAKPSRTTAQ
jgi:hypothetical protein